MDKNFYLQLCEEEKGIEKAISDLNGTLEAIKLLKVRYETSSANALPVISPPIVTEVPVFSKPNTPNKNMATIY